MSKGILDLDILEKCIYRKKEDNKCHDPDLEKAKRKCYMLKGKDLCFLNELDKLLESKQ